MYNIQAKFASHSINDLVFLTSLKVEGQKETVSRSFADKTRPAAMDEDYFRAKIHGEQAELTALSDVGKAARAPVTLDQQSVGRLSRMDAMQQQSMDLAREDRRRARLAVLAAALVRLDNGDFGYCLSCGEDITPARLGIDPAVTLCITCQR